MDKKKKILSICLPVSLFATTLAITAGVVVASTRTVNVIVNKQKMNEFASHLLKPELSNLSIKEFNNLFTNHVNKNEYLNSVTQKLGIKPEHVSSINASGKIQNATISINATDKYKFLNDNTDDTVTTPKLNIESKIINDGKTLIFTGVKFGPELLEISQQKIDVLGQKINQITNNISIDNFNILFNGENEETNFNLIAKNLGINRDAIVSVVASPTSVLGSSTITITISSEYKVANNKEKEFVYPSSIGSIVDNKIIFNNVIFEPIVKISNFANPSRLGDHFTTYTNNEEILQSYNYTQGATLTSDGGLSINISSDTTNQYFSVKLPNTVDNVFDVSDLGINGAKIEWSIKENQPSEFVLETDKYSNYQFIHNKNNNSSNGTRFNSLVLIASIRNSNGVKVVKDVEVTLNFNWKISLPTVLTLDANYLKNNGQVRLRNDRTGRGAYVNNVVTGENSITIYYDKVTDIQFSEMCLLIREDYLELAIKESLKNKGFDINSIRTMSFNAKHYNNYGYGGCFGHVGTNSNFWDKLVVTVESSDSSFLTTQINFSLSCILTN